MAEPMFCLAICLIEARLAAANDFAFLKATCPS